MTGSAERPKAQRTIGRFSVVSDPILIRRFQDATLLGESDRTAYDVPLTLPIAWLGIPEIKTVNAGAKMHRLAGVKVRHG